ncbi:MAG: hypothetical protein ABIE42_05755 [Candidatus Eisenbacteria bacterium]
MDRHDPEGIGLTMGANDPDKPKAVFIDDLWALISEGPELRHERRTVEALFDEIRRLLYERGEAREDLKHNAAILARQTDLAREAEHERDEVRRELFNTRAALGIEQVRAGKLDNLLVRLEDAEECADLGYMFRFGKGMRPCDICRIPGYETSYRVVSPTWNQGAVGGREVAVCGNCWSAMVWLWLHGPEGKGGIENNSRYHKKPPDPPKGDNNG